MNHDQLLGELPLQYAVALRLRAIGSADHVIAAALDVDAAAVEALVDLADQKLQSLQGRAAKLGVANQS